MTTKRHPSTRAPGAARIALILALAFAVIAGACSSDDDSSASSDSGPSTTETTTASSDDGGGDSAATVITTAWPADITSLDPADLSTGQDQELARNLYQQLVMPAFVEQDDGSLKYDDANVKPYLAASWDLEDTAVTFHLRDDVTFYPSGNPLTADDVVFSLTRVFETPGAGDLKGNGVQSPDSITKVDDSSVRIEFTDSNGDPTPVTPTFMFIFSSHFMSIVDSATVLEHATADDPFGAEWLQENTAGTGPYYIDSRDPGVGLTLKAIPDAWTPLPEYQEVKIRVTSGSVSSLVEAGEINFAEFGMTTQQVQSLADAGFSVPWQNTGFFDMFAITAAPEDEVGPLADKRVRQAIAYALPYDDILNNIVYGRGDRAYSIVSPSAPEYTDAWSAYVTDIDKAKALMDEAGNPSIDMPLHYLQANEDQTNKAILIQASLEKIGIKTTLTPETQAGLFDVLNARSTPAPGDPLGPPGFELFNWSPFSGDPSIVIGYWATTGGINNYTLWSSPRVDEVQAEFAAQASSAERTAAYQEAQDIIAEDAAMIPIVLTGTITVVAPGIEGVSFTPGGSGRFWTLHPTGTPSALVDSLLSA